VIGLAAAMALFAAGLWMLVDWWCDPRPLPAPHFRLDPLRRLRRLLRQAELGWTANRLAAGSVASASIVGALVYQVLGWLVPSLFAAAACVVAPLGYAVLRRNTIRAQRQEALIVVLERLRQELETVTLQEALLRLRATAPEALTPTFAQLERDITVLRLPLADALKRTQAQLDDRMWDGCVAVFSLAERTGGAELGRIIERFGRTMRTELELRRTIRAQQAQQIDSARLTMLMPVAVVVFLRLFYPNAEQFYAGFWGEMLLLACGCSIVFGYWLMLRVGEVPHVSRLVMD
jgi:Flp pilus assembly protein TadB